MRLGILTGGGDCPGLNAVIRAAVLSSVAARTTRPCRLRGRLAGPAREPRPSSSRRPTSRTCRRGGTMLGTSRTNPYKVDGGVAKLRAAWRGARARRAGRDRRRRTRWRGHEAGGRGPRRGRHPQDDRQRRAPAPTTRSASTPRSTSSPRRSTPAHHRRVARPRDRGRGDGPPRRLDRAYAGLAGGADVTLLPEFEIDLAAVCRVVAGRRKAAGGVQHRRRGRGRASSPKPRRRRAWRPSPSASTRSGTRASAASASVLADASSRRPGSRRAP